MVNKKLTKAQLKELKAFFISQGVPSERIAEYTHPANAWDNYQQVLEWKRDQEERLAKQLEASCAVSELSPTPGQPKPKRRGRGPGKKPKKVVTTVQLEPDQLEGLQRLAEVDDRTVSSVIRLAVRDYLERRGNG